MVFFYGLFFLERVKVTCIKTVIHLPWTYKKIYCIGEPNRFFDYRDTLLRQRDILLLLLKKKKQ